MNNEQDIEKTWTCNPMASMEDDLMEGSSGVNTSTPCAGRDTVGYKQYRHVCNVANESLVFLHIVEII